MFPARRAPLLSAVIVGVGAALVWELTVAGPLFAALFAYTEGPGITIITDSPTQLSRCRPLTDSTVTPREERPHRSAPDPVLTLPAPVESPQLASPSKEQAVYPASISVPVERLGALLIVTAHLNRDQPTRLILDTGASHTLLSHRVAQELGLFSFPPVALVTLQTVGGSVQAEVVQVDSIQLAGGRC